MDNRNTDDKSVPSYGFHLTESGGEILIPLYEVSYGDEILQFDVNRSTEEMITIVNEKLIILEEYRDDLLLNIRKYPERNLLSRLINRELDDLKSKCTQCNIRISNLIGIKNKIINGMVDCIYTEYSLSAEESRRSLHHQLKNSAKSYLVNEQ